MTYSFGIARSYHFARTGWKSAACVLLACLMLVSCKVRLPEGIPSESKMEDLLYDYQLAQSLASLHKDSLAYYERYYTAAVLAKYRMSSADFDRALAYYTANAEVLGRIYMRIDQRLSQTTSATPHEQNPYAQMTDTSADTLNLWREKDFYILSPQDRNRMDFVLQADSTLHPGDRLMFEFSPRWIYREGQKDAFAVLALHYVGDSVAVSQTNIGGSGRQSVSITIGDRPLERVTGFVYQNAGWKPTTQLMVISMPALVRFRSHQPAKSADEVSPDDESEMPVTDANEARIAAERRIRDSLLRQDTMSRPHFRDAEPVRQAGEIRRGNLHRRKGH